MTIYIDSDYKCHVSDDGTMTPVETDFFDGKCPAFIEGYRYVPSGCTWTRSDGEIFHGEMIAPWQDIRELRLAQLEYENERMQAELAEAKETAALLGDCLLEMSEVVYA